jgi:uncharacterized protein YdbL (DUF1318 family)
MKNTKNIINTFSRVFLTSMFMLCFFATSAFALDLAQAKQAGLVGEKPTGYLAAVTTSPTAEVNQLISKTNAARKAEYERIAKKNGTKVSVVEQFGGKEAIERTEAGHYVFVGGAWKKK